jgi:hypothetical protein
MDVQKDSVVHLSFKEIERAERWNSSLACSCAGNRLLAFQSLTDRQCVIVKRCPRSMLCLDCAFSSDLRAQLSRRKERMGESPVTHCVRQAAPQAGSWQRWMFQCRPGSHIAQCHSLLGLTFTWGQTRHHANIVESANNDRLMGKRPRVIRVCARTHTRTDAHGLQGSFVEEGALSNEEMEAIVKNWTFVEDHPCVIDAEIEEAID